MTNTRNQSRAAWGFCRICPTRGYAAYAL